MLNDISESDPTNYRQETLSSSAIQAKFLGEYELHAFSKGCAITQAVSRWLPTTAARVQTRV
jgi:hypothetical protein